MKANLTPEFVATNLTCPEGQRRIEYTDHGPGKVPGMYIEVRATNPGTGTYYLRYKNPLKKTCHLRIGCTSEMTLDDARKRAKAMRAKVTLGIDPRENSQATPSATPKPEVPTLGTYFDQSYWPHIVARNRDAKKSRRIFDHRIRERFGHLRLDELSREQIQVFHTSLLQDEGLAPATANHHLRLLKTMYRRAVDWEITNHNPTTRIPLFREDNKIEHLLSDEELARLLNVLRTHPARNACDVALLLLSTGARLSEALHAEWTDIDRERRLWRIPARNSKSKKIRSVPLNDAALDVLDRLDTVGMHGHLFVNPRGERLKHIHACWNRLRRRAGLPHFRLHDLRHQYASFLVNSGRTLYEVQAILGHSDPVVTQRYAHLSTKALQEASDSAADAINGALRGSA